jgi:hypothetical protein
VTIPDGSYDFATRAKVMERLIRALILDRSVYEEVAEDRTALSQAIGVVLLAGIVNGMAIPFLRGLVGALVGIVVSVAGWLLFSVIVYLIGARVMRAGATSFRTVACCLGFADIPAVVNLLGVLPVIGVAVRITVWFWLLAAAIVATRAAFGVSRARGAVIAGLGFVVYVLLGVLAGLWAG